jgi:hypothetical protein
MFPLEAVAILGSEAFTPPDESTVGGLDQVMSTDITLAVENSARKKSTYFFTIDHHVQLEFIGWSLGPKLVLLDKQAKLLCGQMST